MDEMEKVSFSGSSEHGGAGISPKAFQKIIAERKAEVKEKAELKRLYDLQRVREMKSREGNNPGEVFPEEVWELILDELNPADRGNIWQLHDAFRDIMRNSHVQENLFPQVLKFDVDHISPINNGNDSSDSDNDSKDAEGPTEVVKRRLPLAHFLNLRGVCKSLRSEVDRALEEDLLRILRDGCHDTKPRMSMAFAFCYGFDDDIYDTPDFNRLNRLLAFTDQDLHTHYHFLSRSLCLMFDSYEENPYYLTRVFEPLKKKITSLLHHAGESIWHFRFEFFQSEDDGVSRLADVYMALVQWLKMMPNLKWLQVRLYFSCLLFSDFDINQLLECQPPPTLEALNRMEFFLRRPSVSEKIQAIYRALIFANPQVTNLHMHGANSLLQSATTLNLESFSMGYSAISFVKMRSVNWNLKRIYLGFNKDLQSIAPVFQCLQRFQSLEQVSLNFSLVTIGDGIDFLELPNLTEFELSICTKYTYNFLSSWSLSPIHFFFNLQFLLFSKKLKMLTWTNTSLDSKRLMLHMEGSNQLRNMIEFGGGYSDLSKSNIWQVFPQLEFLKVGVRDVGHRATPIEIIREYRKGMLVHKIEK